VPRPAAELLKVLVGLWVGFGVALVWPAFFWDNHGVAPAGGCL